MTLTVGSRLGPHEILAPIGAGGMGEVYRARDTRLGRDVAVKVIRSRFAADADQLRRFEKEARAAAQLDHPNVLVVHDIGNHEGSPYIVSELLEGESLREKLGAPLPPRKAVEYALQVAHGLAAAHEKGIVHRDFKPENLFVTKDGRVKILDFGVAKLTQPALPSISVTEAPTAAPATDVGVIMGTVGYMSPEQVLGKPLDARSDLFSFGVVLYEMLAGKRPFQKETAPETMAAILREEPPDLSATNLAVPPGLERIVRHCLEKEAPSRFQSARDIAFALESLSQTTTAGTAPLRVAGRKRRVAVAVLGIALVAASGAGLFVWGKQTGRPSMPSFKRITFRRGWVNSARFTPDFQSVVYTAAWEGKPAELFVQRLASADARPLGVINANVVGTAGGDVAIGRYDGTLAQLPLEGGTPRDLLKDIDGADWDRSGTRFAIVRAVKGGQRLEYPVGKILFETKGLGGIAGARVSPDGMRVAFVFKPTGATEEAGDVCVVDLSGQKRTLSEGWLQVWTTAWSPDGKEIWFSATRGEFRVGLHAVTLSGRERVVARFPGNPNLLDIAPDGRLLFAYGQTRRFETRGRMAGDAAERDLTWLDGTLRPTLAPDGTQMVFQEWSEGGGYGGAIYHWRMDGSAPKRLGDGMPMDVSPDWTTALVLVGSREKRELKLLPIGAGETTTLPSGSIHDYDWGVWHPDGKRIVISGSDAEGKMRLFVQDIAGGPPRSLAEAENLGPFSPDGRFISTRPKEGVPYAFCPIDGGESRPIPFLKTNERPIVFSDDGKSLFVLSMTDPGKFPLHVLRLDLKTGKREPWLELAPPDRAGIAGIYGLRLTPNGRFYTYGYRRRLWDLYLAEGLK
jgi:serine/threonine protein kinase